MKSMHDCQLGFASPSYLTDLSLGNYQGPASFSQLSFSLWSINTCPVSNGTYSIKHAFAVSVFPFQAYVAYERSNPYIHATSYQPRQPQNPSITAIRRLSSHFAGQKAATVQKMQKKENFLT